MMASGLRPGGCVLAPPRNADSHPPHARARAQLFDLSRTNWTLRVKDVVVASPWLGAWMAWEGRATVKALEQQAVVASGWTARWNATDVARVTVQSAAWADGSGCNTWG